VKADGTSPPAHETNNENNVMKKKLATANRKAAVQPRSALRAGPKASLLALLWIEVHPKPARPIGHPIPPLTPTPIPPVLKAKQPQFKGRRPAAVDYLSSLLCPWLAVVLLATGCVAGRPLQGGRAVTTRKPTGLVEQTLRQGENAAQATKQDQESVRVRSYTVPAGSRLEETRVETISPGVPLTNTQAILVSAPMPVVEREETRARTELGAAQKDTARELGARLASLKGIVWIGAGLFVFGLASLVWPPLKAVIASVTTSAALMLGGVALMVLPTLVVGHELLMLGGVGLAVGAWFLAHRHGQLRGAVGAAGAAGQSAVTPGAVAGGKSSVISGQ
jgi:hypothetical protein